MGVKTPRCKPLNVMRMKGFNQLFLLFLLVLSDLETRAAAASQAVVEGSAGRA